jgi:hypothetical protein
VVSYGIAINQKEFTAYTPPSILHGVLVGAGSLWPNQSSTSDAKYMYGNSRCREAFTGGLSLYSLDTTLHFP